jgi:NAD(P)-dependent dehydrogenase (short-subunit alcohol dehydrogenase family)
MGVNARSIKTAPLGGSMDINDLRGRRILLTGAASGIGLETAKLFSEQGATVAMADRDAGVADAAKGLANCHPVVMDVTSEAQVAAGIEAAARAMGGIDGLVNCAGADFSGSILDTTPEQWNRIMSVNLTGPYLVTRAAVPVMRREKAGSIVNVASGLGLIPLVNRSAYCGSKAGLIMFSKALSMELAPQIRVNVVCPGIVDTPMLRKAWPTDEAMKQITGFYAMKRVPSPREMAHSILFLIGNASSHITGIALASDGGRSFH